MSATQLRETNAKVYEVSFAYAVSGHVCLKQHHADG